MAGEIQPTSRVCQMFPSATIAYTGLAQKDGTGVPIAASNYICSKIQIVKGKSRGNSLVQTSP